MILADKLRRAIRWILRSAGEILPGQQDRRLGTCVDDSSSAGYRGDLHLGFNQETLESTGHSSRLSASMVAF